MPSCISTPPWRVLERMNDLTDRLCTPCWSSSCRQWVLSTVVGFPKCTIPPSWHSRLGTSHPVLSTPFFPCGHRELTTCHSTALPPLQIIQNYVSINQSAAVYMGGIAGALFTPHLCFSSLICVNSYMLAASSCFFVFQNRSMGKGRHRVVSCCTSLSFTESKKDSCSGDNGRVVWGRWEPLIWLGQCLGGCSKTKVWVPM